MIILEIILTIVAWFRGWKWKSLIPLGSLLAMGFVIGYIYGIFGYTGDSLIESQPWLGLLDLIGVLILATMCIVTPKKLKNNKENETK